MHIHITFCRSQLIEALLHGHLKRLLDGLHPHPELLHQLTPLALEGLLKDAGLVTI